MATYVNNLRLKEITTGDEDGTWGTSTNTNLELIADALGFNTQAAFSSDGDVTTTVADGAADPARALYFKVTSGTSLSTTRTLTIAPNTVSRVMFIENATSGSQSINISQGSGANVTIANGKVALVYLDGAGSGAAVVLASPQVAVTQLTDVTSTASELNLVDGSSAGTIVNSKAVIYGSSGEVNGTTLQIAGNSITSTAAELNLVDGSTADTVVNSKAVIYGAAGQITANELDVDNIQIDANAVKSTDTNGNIQLFPNGTGFTELYGNTNAGAIRFNCESNSHGITVKGAPHSASATYSLELPNALGSSGQVLSLSDGAGKLAFTTPATTTLGDLGITSSAAELNLNDGSSAGTIVNSKTVVYGSSGEVNATTLQISGTAITSTAAEINLLDALSRGSIVYGNSSGASAILTSGSANTVLTSDGNDISWQAVSGGVLELANSNSTIKLSGSSVGAQSIDLSTNNSALAATNEEVIVLGYEAASASIGTSFDQTVVIGTFAARNIQSNRNVVVGTHAVSNNTMTGAQNTCIGAYAGRTITSGEQNIHIGYEGGDKQNAGTYDKCVLIGSETDAGGDYNVAVGHASGANSSSLQGGTGNTYLGAFAGDQGVDSGNYCIAIGYQARTSTSSYINKFVIGYNFAGRNDSETISIGNGSNYIYNDFATNASWYRVSDERLKRDFALCELGLDFINDLEPLTYRWKPISEVDPSMLQETAQDRKNIDNYYVGFKAQNVKAALEKHGAKDYGFVNQADETGRLALAYEELITPLVQAVKELSAKVEKLETQLEDMGSQQ